MEEKNRRESILIVDDTPENLTVLHKMLAENGYRVRPALNGEIALKTTQADLPDLILLDIIMPGLDGYEVCHKLKAQENTRDIPIIFISALNEIEDKMRAFSEGGVDYITKPFQSQEVLARVKTHISLKRANEKLKQMIKDIKTLRGLLPICSHCKKIRKADAEPSDPDSWVVIEQYVARHTHAEFSHGMCPDCLHEFYSDEDWYKKRY